MLHKILFDLSSTVASTAHNFKDAVDKKVKAGFRCTLGVSDLFSSYERLWSSQIVFVALFALNSCFLISQLRPLIQESRLIKQTVITVFINILSSITKKNSNFLSFLKFFSDFFSVSVIKRSFHSVFYSLQGSLASFDVTFHDLIATRRAIIYGHTWGLDQQKCFFERPTMRI